MRLDIHHHLIHEPGYVEQLLKTMDTFNIDRVCLSGIELQGPTSLGDLSPGNADVLRAFEQHPERIIPMANVRLGIHSVDDVQGFLARGFQGVKTTRPLKPYGDPAYDSIYGLLQDRGVPVLFHTGIVLRTLTDAADDVSSDRMRPVTLDRVARTFPQLRMVMAHLGVPWNEEAAMMIRIHPNVYADLTGAPGGWLEQKVQGFRHLLYWPQAIHKIVFGTDVHWRDIPWAMRLQEQAVGALTEDPQDHVNFFGETAHDWF